MASLPPQTYPITGLCIVANPDKCPPGYELLYRSHDKKDDCDLWKDSIFKARVTRYLCVTRVFPLDGGRLNNVLADVHINNNGELPPTGFTVVEKTVDTGERATRKKQLCVKMMPRNATADAISELIILSKNKRPPAGYTLFGEMNGLCLCYKMSPVPSETQNLPVTNGAPAPAALPYGPPTPATGYMNSGSSQVYHPYTGWGTPHVPAPNYSQGQQPGWVGSSPPSGQQQTWMGSESIQGQQQNWVSAPSYPLPSAHQVELQGSGSAGHNPLVRQESNNTPYRTLDGVPFQLNQKYQALQNSKQPSTVPELQFRSHVDIDNEYHYPFRLEKQATTATE